MTPAEFRAEMTRLGATQARLAALLGYDRRQVIRWLAGEAEIPKVVALLLEKLTPEEVR